MWLVLVVLFYVITYLSSGAGFLVQALGIWCFGGG